MINPAELNAVAKRAMRVGGGAQAVSVTSAPECCYLPLLVAHEVSIAAPAVNGGQSIAGTSAPECYLPPWAHEVSIAAHAVNGGRMAEMAARIEQLEREKVALEQWSADRATELQRDKVSMERLVVLYAGRLARIEEEASKPPPLDNAADAVQRRVDATIGDLLAGRTTQDQRRGLGSATERAGRVTKPGSDAAIGAISGKGGF